MTVTDILFIVQYETGIRFTEMKGRRHHNILMARYLVVVMMREEGIRHADIARLFGVHRTCIYSSLKTINGLLETDKSFKSLYRGCIKRMADMEEAA